MKNGVVSLLALMLAGCDPYGYGRFDDMDPDFQIYIAIHKSCLDALANEPDYRVRDKKDWTSAKYRNADGSEHTYDINFHNVDQAGATVICSVDVDDLKTIKLRRAFKLEN